MSPHHRNAGLLAAFVLALTVSVPCLGPTLITVGDHDECDASLSRQMNALIAGSRLVVLPRSGHMTFIDQPGLFIDAVQSFLTPAK